MTTNILNHADKRMPEEIYDAAAKLHRENSQAAANAPSQQAAALKNQLQLIRQNNESRFKEGVSYVIGPCISALEGALEAIDRGDSGQARKDISALLDILKPFA